jgi:hypothetical protein
MDFMAEITVYSVATLIKKSSLLEGMLTHSHDQRWWRGKNTPQRLPVISFKHKQILMRSEIMKQENNSGSECMEGIGSCYCFTASHFGQNGDCIILLSTFFNSTVDENVE